MRFDELRRGNDDVGSQYGTTSGAQTAPHAGCGVDVTLSWMASASRAMPGAYGSDPV